MNDNTMYCFNDDKRSSRIFRSDRPAPWIQSLSKGRQHAFVSRAGGNGGRMDSVGAPYSFGIKSPLHGQENTPCIPADWKEYSGTCEARGARYQISRSNPAGVVQGVKKRMVNGQVVESYVIDPEKVSGKITIKVLMGDNE